jgi:hypothetical protein
MEFIGAFSASSPRNVFPFGFGSMRYQQVFGVSDFAFLGGPVLISQILFRPDAVTGFAFSSTIANIRVDLSTSLNGPDALNPTFANNVGLDNVIVFNGALSLSSADAGPAAGPKNFDIVINLTTPFLYDFTKGALLLDVRNVSGGTTTPFDAANTFGDTVSRVFADGVNSLTGSADSFGLVTQFTTTPVNAAVPEPATLALLGAGLSALLARRRKKR